MLHHRIIAVIDPENCLLLYIPSVLFHLDFNTLKGPIEFNYFRVCIHCSDFPDPFISDISRENLVSYGLNDNSLGFDAEAVGTRFCVGRNTTAGICSRLGSPQMVLGRRR